MLQLLFDVMGCRGVSEDDAGDSPTFTESILLEDPRSRSRSKKNPEARAELFDDLSPKHEFSEHVARARVEALFLGGGEGQLLPESIDSLTSVTLCQILL